MYYPQSITFGALIDPNINPLRPTTEFAEIQELINTAAYINTQVSDAQASVVEMSLGVPESSDSVALTSSCSTSTVSITTHPSAS